MSAPHTAVKHELLVRCLDAWTPAAAHGHKTIGYVEGFADRHHPVDSSAAAAVRVFGEFADVLAGHTIIVVLAGAGETRLDALREHLDGLLAQYAAVAGLAIRTVVGVGALAPVLARGPLRGAPLFGWFDHTDLTPLAGLPSTVDDGEISALAAVTSTVMSTVAGRKGGELILALPAGSTPAPALPDALAWHAAVELVDEAGAAQLLRFATGSEKSLEMFKDELWALDEYAGIRYRDPIDPDRAVLDISLQPQLGPLRRAIAARVRETGGSTVADLRGWTVRETVYRAADATRALPALVASGQVVRVPGGGRLSPETRILPAG
jgi:hypothetical protein